MAGGLAGLLLATRAFYLGQGYAGGTAVSAPIVQTSGKTGALDAAAIYKADAQGTTLVESRLFGLGGGQGTALGSGLVRTLKGAS